MGKERTHQLAFFAALTMLFGLSATATINWCMSMSGMSAMPMCGGQTMSMIWMILPGQTWLSAGFWFLEMWLVMMAAMMLPSLIPLLWRDWQRVTPRGAGRAAPASAMICVGYFFVWTILGVIVFPVGVAFAQFAMREPWLSILAPLATSGIFIATGLAQFSTWKARHLACWHNMAPGCAAPVDGIGAAWRHGLMLGLRCSQGCAGLMIVLLAAGVMDLRAMAAVTLAITVERVAPKNARAPQVIGLLLTGTGFFMLVHRGIQGGLPH